MRVICLLLLLSSVGALAAPAPTITNSTPTNPALHGGAERAEAKVLKVFEVKDDTAVCRSYLVQWKGQETIVSDTLGHSKRQVGDTIQFMVLRLPSPMNSSSEQILRFELMMPSAARVVAFKFPGANQVANPRQKIPSYLDCQPEKLVLYPGMTNVALAALQQTGNPVERLLDEIQADRQHKYLVVMVRPGSVQQYRAIRNLISARPIDVSYKAVDTEFKPEWNEAIKALGLQGATNQPPSASPPVAAVVPMPVPAGRVPPAGQQLRPEIVTVNKQPVFFECRANELFHIDKADLDAQIAKLPVRPGPENAQQLLKALQGQQLGTAFYRVNPSRLLMGMLALEPRPDVHGQTPQQLLQPNSPFQTLLKQLNPATHYVAFLVRDDSFAVYRQASTLAEQARFETGWELLAAEEPIKFGLSAPAINPLPN